MSPRAGIGLAAAAAALAACGGRADVYDRPLAISPPVALLDEVAYLDTTRDEVVLLRPFPYRARRLPIGPRGLALQAARDRAHLAVLSAGRDDAGATVAPALHWIDVPSGAVTTYPLGSPFDRVEVDADGHRALAFFSTDATPGGDVFLNPNEAAIIDLTAPPAADNPSLRTVRSFGSAPLGVVFSPPMCIPAAAGCPGREHLFAVVLAAGAVTFLDLARPERSEITVRLQVGPAPTVAPAEVLFAPDQSTAFLRAAGSADVFVINLLPREPTSADANDWWPSLNQLSAGQDPTDIAWFDDDGRRKVLAVNRGSRDVSVIDAATAGFVRIPVGIAADRALLLPPSAPEVAVLYASGAGAGTVYFLDLHDVEREGAANLAAVDVGRAAREVVPAPDGRHALVIHDDRRTVLSVLDVHARTVAPIQGSLPLSSFGFALGARATLVGVADGLARVGFVDLGNLHPWDLPIDRAPVGLSVLGNGVIVVHHAGSAGSLTALPSPSAAPSAAVRLDGFLLDGILDARPGDRPEQVR